MELIVSELQCIKQANKQHLTPILTHQYIHKSIVDSKDVSHDAGYQAYLPPSKVARHY